MLQQAVSILEEIIPAISLIISYQKEQNLYHTWRVAIMASYLAEEILPDEVFNVFYAGLLHDIGLLEDKWEIDFYSLSVREHALIPALRDHPLIGAKIISDIPDFIDISNFIQDHHEWWNGDGYPNSKKGQDISLGGQLLRIADSFDLRLRMHPRPTITDLYNYFRISANKEYSKELWPAILEVKSRDAGRIFYQLSQDLNLPVTFEKVIKRIPFPKTERSINNGLDNLEIAAKVLGRIVDAKDSYTQGHSERVARYAEEIAKRMGLSDRELRQAKFSGFLHDVGKVAIPISILDKPGPLTKEEYEIMKSHAIVTMEIIDSIRCLRDLSPIAGSDQERYDGKGYPDGLRDDEIPLLSRILSVADAMDAMSSNRAYRPAMDYETIIKELRINAGTQFDAKVIDAAVSYLNEKGTINEPRPS